ncbi:MAG TPA: SDR family oxidoreductase [Nocardioides sp.]|nr:SDR family oxidoreductase [Nocardioides sp.]
MSAPVALVTGASTGIGRTTALHLAARGWEVLAGVRTDAAAASLEEVDGVRPVLLDVTDPTSVKAAAGVVAEVAGPRGLAGLVNNAGIQAVGPLELLPVDRVRDVLETNVLGQVAVTQSLLPQLRAGTGRIVFLSSLSGAVALPFLGAYAASKHAVEAIGDSWRRELRPHGIRVAIVEPGNIATPIWDKGLDPAPMDALGPDLRRLYGSGVDFTVAQARHAAEVAIPPERVAAAIEHALTARRPRQRYLVGTDARIAVRLQRHAPRLLDRLLTAAMERDARRRT